VHSAGFGFWLGGQTILHPALIRRAACQRVSRAVFSYMSSLHALLPGFHAHPLAPNTNVRSRTDGEHAA